MFYRLFIIKSNVDQRFVIGRSFPISRVLEIYENIFAKYQAKRNHKHISNQVFSYVSISKVNCCRINNKTEDKSTSKRYQKGFVTRLTNQTETIGVHLNETLLIDIMA